MTMRSYLRLDGVAGDSTDDDHAGWIACDSVSWSLRAGGSLGGLSEIRFVKAEDGASAALARLCIAATPLAGARFDFVRAGPDGAWVRCYGIELEQVTVANVATGPSREPGMMETVVLAFVHARLTAGEQPSGLA